MKRNYKQLYALLNKQPGLSKYENVTDFKNNLVYSVSCERTESLQELSDKEYCQLVALLKNTDKDKSVDKLRKRVIASIFGLMKILGKQVDMEYVKAIAVRAAGDGVQSFNKISKSKLVTIYNLFLNYQKTAKNIEKEEAILEMNARLLAFSGIDITVNAEATD